MTILKLFFNSPEKEFYLIEIAKETKVSTATTFRIVGKLTELGVLKKIKIAKFKLYMLNQNENVEFLQSFIREDIQVLKLFINQIKELPNIEAIILHGKESTSRANLLIIGEDIDQAPIKILTGEIKEKYDFTLSYLVLAKEQYEQMSNMGLYSGQKKILFDKNKPE